ncbi:MAG: HlyD family efflux transporter periplasmic adaptor subunit [Acidobacteria bacterium]|nr:MAG: HlyD family efflux transporter periplasmic adaptor subunit [Acidobacteriota bacterium]
MKGIKKLMWMVGLITSGLVAVNSCGWLGSGHSSVISVSGNIEFTEVDIAFKVPGRLVELTVDEGDEVKKGMVVARLDQEQLLRQRDRARAVLRAAQSRLAQLRTAIQFQKETVQGQIALRRAELDQAMARLRELEAGSRHQEIERARAAVDRARSVFERAKKDWDRAQVLYENDDISTAQFEQTKMQFESARAQLEEAEQRLALIEEGPRQEQIDAARAQVARARASLRLAEAQRLEIRRKEQELETVKAEIRRARAELAVIESQLADTVAVSPVDGVVLVKAAEVGEVLAAGTPVITVGDWDHPWLRGYINEPDLGRVKLGARVRVTTDSYPHKVYWGRLSFISSEAEFTPKHIQTEEERVKLVYRIKIDIDNPEHELKLNMPVEAEIVLDDEEEKP